MSAEERWELSANSGPILTLVTLLEPGSGSLVMTTSAAEEHQRHQATSDQKREESAKAKGDPAVHAHRNIAAGVPDVNGPEGSDDKQRDKCNEQYDLSCAYLGSF